MRDWCAYIRRYCRTDLWGFVALDYYHRTHPNAPAQSPTAFLDWLIQKVYSQDIDIVRFHRVLLLLCVELFGRDLDAVIEKSLAIILARAGCTDGELAAIVAHYHDYHKEKDFERALVAATHPPEGNDMHLVERRATELPSPNPSGFDEALASDFLAAPFRNTPLLLRFAQDRILAKEKPFAGMRAICVLHFLRDLVPFLEACTQLGMAPLRTTLFFKEYRYPQRRPVAEYLAARGYQVLPVTRVQEYLGEMDKSTNAEIGNVLVIEDGGIVTPALHRAFPNVLARAVGTVEQTTRGITNCRAWEGEVSGNHLAIPVLSVAGSDLKRRFEPPFVANAVKRNILRLLPETAWYGKRVAVLGAGAIGSAVAREFLAEHAEVVVYEPSSTRKLDIASLPQGCRHAASANEACSDAYLVVGASGAPSVNAGVISVLRDDTYVASASSEQYEIDIATLAERRIREEPLVVGNRLAGTTYVLPPRDRRIHVLADGYPVNFWGQDSMPHQASDLVLSLLLLSAVGVASGRYTDFGINEDAVNELAEQHGVAEQYCQIHQLG